MKRLLVWKATSVFVILMCIGGLKQIKSQSTNNIVYLHDSINSQLDNSNIDTLLLKDLFYTITKNRRKLKKDYKPLLIKYINKSESQNYIYGMMSAYDRLGLQERQETNYDTAIYYHKKSLNLALQLADSNQLGFNYRNLGQAYRKQDMNAIAIKYFHQALTILEPIGDTKNISYTMNSLGAAYVVQQDYQRAIYYFDESNKLAIQLNNTLTMSFNYRAKGEVFMLQNQIDSAMHYFELAKNVRVDDRRGIAVANHLIGQAYFQMGDFKQSKQLFQNALSTHIATENYRYQALCYAFLGKIQLEYKHNDSAYIYLQKAKNIALKIHSIEHLLIANDALFKYYTKNNNWQQAIETISQSQQFKDSIANQINAKELRLLEVEYQTEKKQQRIELLYAENEIKSQRIRLGSMLIVALLLSIILGIYVHQMRKKQGQIEQEKIKQQLFRSQMNPHFIFNALGSIQHFMYKNDAKSAAKYMGNFANLSRSILNNSAAESISLEEEIITLENYTELEKMRMNNGFEYKIVGAEDLETEFIKIPPMMIQPFIENAIKHGLKDRETGGELTISFTDNETMLKVEITDNGIGLNKAAKQKDEKHKSMATEIFSQRMKIFQKKHKNIPEPELIDISNNNTNNTGTKVIVYLPIIEE